ncbi:MAG: YraN family protein, partial [Bacteroidetes bacterium]|nr:YraN family protein [Bacteroidota bacterium]
VIVEVKTRKSNSLVEPEASVTKMKQRNLIAAANFYLKVTNSQKEARFDIIGITYLKSDFSVNHIIDAFYPLIRSR